MHKRAVLVIALLLALSSVALAQDANATQPDPCAGVTCNPTQLTCPDGSPVSCQNSCSNGACSQCTPSCAGHETAQSSTANQSSGSQPSSTQPPSGSGSSQLPANTSQTEPTFQSPANNVIPIGQVPLFPNPVNATSPCPVLPPYGSCDGSLVTRYENGCPARYDCIAGNATNAQPACENIETNAVDASGRCARFPSSCLPPGWRRVDSCPESRNTCGNNICEPGEADVPGGCGPDADPRCIGPPGQAGTCPQDCRPPERREQCGNGVCERGEESHCRQDCISARQECPLRRSCGEGSEVQCRPEQRGGCYCDPCPVRNIPAGCRQEADKGGFTRIVCEQQHVCPAAQHDYEEIKSSCVEKGGRFEVRKDFNGCEFPDCSFGAASAGPVPIFNPLEAERKCAVESEEQREATRQNCEKLGLSFVISVQGGCKISKCSTKPQKRGCEPVYAEERSRVENKCRQNGLEAVKDFDENGCPLMRCGEPAYCPREMPPDAYEKCGEQGGELVIRKNNMGCISFSQCLLKGDIREADVDPIENLPEPAELLSMAFRMEELKIELDKLAKKTDDIADYYASTKSPDEGRYRRVSDMFEAATGKVEEIKEKLRDFIEKESTKDDLIGIKRDIRYIKDVMMKDILYLMLSSSDDVKEIKESRAVRVGDDFEEVEATDETNCGSDDRCFDRAFRLCKKVIFYPEGRKGPKVEVRGLEGDTCIMYAVMPEGEGPPAGSIPGVNPPYEMTCKIKKYSLGIRSPEEDVFPYCEGPMVQLMKMFEESGGAPGVPGKCSGDKCRDYCGRGAAEAKECLEHLGPYLPADARAGLEQLARGERSSFGGPGNTRDFSSGQTETPRECIKDGSFIGREKCERIMRERFGGGFENQGQGEFGRPTGEFSQGSAPRTTSGSSAESRQGTQTCVGCLNNNVCDPGECSQCPDCVRR